MLLSNSSKFYPRSLTLVIHILEMVRGNYTQAQIAKTLGIAKSLVFYYVKKGIVLGYLKEIGRDRIKILELTQKGTKFLDQYEYKNKYNNRISDRKQLPTCGAENIRFKARVYRQPTKPVDWKRVEMNNWHQYSGVVDNIKIHLNNGKAPSIEFIPSPIDGNNPLELFGILHYECNQVARKLEHVLDMEIGRLELESRAEWVVYDDPVAKLISRYNGQITVDGLGKINASKPFRRGELEYFDPRFAADYITMPKRVSNIERLLEDLLRVNKEYTKGNSEDQMDEVEVVEQKAASAEQLNTEDCNSDEEES